MTDTGGRVPPYPLSAVVGQPELVMALVLAGVDRRIGGVLLRGQKGSAKTTAARGLAQVLPGPAPFVELPVGASEDRVVGTIDVRAVLADGTSRLSPGLLAEADGGVLYVDEVNLLPDHLVDVLLDVAVSGVNRVEREGVSQQHPSRFVLLGSMNPEEGELRPQFLDRFGLAVDVAAPLEPSARAEAVRRRLAYDADPAGFVQRWSTHERRLAQRLRTAAPATVPDELMERIAVLCVALGAEGLRADLVCCRAAAALAGWEGRAVAEPDDVRRVAPLALSHRRRRSPFDAPGIDPAELEAALAEAFDEGRQRPRADGRNVPADRPPGDPSGFDGAEGGGEVAATGADPGVGTTDAGAGAGRDALATAVAEGDGSAGDGAPASTAGGAESPRASGGGSSVPWSVPLGSALPAWSPPASQVEPPRVGREVVTGGRGARAEVAARGRRVGAHLVEGPVTDLAVAATVRSAASHGRTTVEPEDAHQSVRQSTVGRLVVLAVDASGSMGAAARVAAASTAAERLLLDAYQRRDRVAVVVFRGETAEVALAPTGSVEVARARLATITTGGRTPLAAGLTVARQVAMAGARRGHRPLLVVLSDGRATAADAGDPWQAALSAGHQVARAGLASVVIDAEDGPVRLGLAGQLAEAMGAVLVEATDITADVITAAVQRRADPGSAQR